MKIPDSERAFYVPAGHDGLGRTRYRHNCWLLDTVFAFASTYPGERSYEQQCTAYGNDCARIYDNWQELYPVIDTTVSQRLYGTTVHVYAALISAALWFAPERTSYHALPIACRASAHLLGVVHFLRIMSKQKVQQEKTSACNADSLLRALVLSDDDELDRKVSQGTDRHEVKNRCEAGERRHDRGSGRNN